MITQESTRLNAQCGAILDVLKLGPATNRELSTIALKYTSRISDIRAKGYNIRVTSRDRKTGLTTYALVGR